MEDLKLDGQDFKYFSLPGDDLIDLYQIRAEVCEKRSLNMRFLGFNTAAHPSNPHQQRLDVNLHGLKRLPNVDQISHIYPDDLKLIARPRSVQRKRISEFGPFHALNIDLCDGLARPGDANGTENLFDALEVVLETQSRTTHDSLIFITSRFDSPEVSPTSRFALSKILRENLENCESFRTAVCNEWGIAPAPDSSSLTADLTEGEQFILGFAKWVISAALRMRMLATVGSVFTYKIVPASTEDDLVSISIRLSPDRSIPPDPSGLSDSKFSTITDECELAGKVPARVSHRRSVDAVLQSDPAAFASAVAETSAVLGDLGYSKTAYLQWVENA